MYRAIRVTTNDYRDYRKANSQIVYSICDKKDYLRGYSFELSVSRQAIELSMRTRTKFIDAVQENGREMYFFYREEEMIGFFELFYHKGKCDIVEFFVFDRYQGNGRLMWDAALEKIKKRNASRIELWSPYAGAQKFWKKMGFLPVKINGVECYRKKL